MALYLDKANAENVVKKVNTNIEELERVANEIDKLITSELPNYWKGVSADKTQTTYQEDYKNFLQRKVPDMVTSLKDYMDGCVKAIAQVDQELAGK